MPLDITLRSLPETEGNSKYPPLEAIRIYESSRAGLVTLVTSNQGGLRLTHEQVGQLVDALCAYYLDKEWPLDEAP